MEKIIIGGVMFINEEHRTGYSIPDSFLIICKEAKCRDRWYANALSIDYEISKRVQPTKSRKHAFTNYDGSMHEHELHQITPYLCLG